jgi:UDP-N-acetylglucosamine kinase
MSAGRGHGSQATERVDIDVDQIFNRDIKPDLDEQISPMIVDDKSTPVVVFIAGQPGAGKSTAQRDVLERLTANGLPVPFSDVVPIDADFLRRYHPYWEDLQYQDDRRAASLTQSAAGEWVDLAIKHVAASRRHAVVSATLKDADDAVLTKIGPFRTYGYHVVVVFIAVHRAQSRLNVVGRYHWQRRQSGHGRYVPSEVHDKAYLGLLDTASRVEDQSVQLVHEVYVYGLGGTDGDANGPIYTSRRLPGGWSQTGARDAIAGERSRRWRRDEVERIRASVEELGKELSDADMLIDTMRDEVAEIIAGLITPEACLPTGLPAHD